MEPRIQYTKSSDGVNIAYWVIGQGPTLVAFNLPNSNIRADWEIAWLRRSHELLARTRTLVRYDPRGFGMSDREVTDFSLEALLRDLEAVADHLRLETFDMIAIEMAVPIGAAYAARYPRRITRLVLNGGSALGSDLWPEAMQDLAALAQKDWEMASRSIVHGVQGWTDESVEVWARILRDAVAPSTYLSFFRQLRTWDVRAVLPEIAAPTLVLHPSRHAYFPAEMARRLAAAIPNARLALIDQTQLSINEESLGVIGSFLAEGQAAAPELSSGTAVILFADIANSTALTERFGDAAFREKAHNIDGALREVIRENAGTPVEGKLLGDGVLAVFTSARQAIDAAVACARSGEEAGLPLHVGLHAGDVIREDNNVYGGAVNVASRIASAAAPGEILVSQTVRDLGRTSVSVSFEQRGRRKLKGVDEPVRLWGVRTSQDHDAR